MLLLLGVLAGGKEAAAVGGATEERLDEALKRLEWMGEEDDDGW